MRRITIVESVNFQSEDGPPLTVLTQAQRLVESDEQPFQKIQKVSEDWKALNTKLFLQLMNNCKIGMLSIRYDKPAQEQVLPTSEQKKLDNARLVKVRLDTVVLSLLPGESLRICPEELPSIDLCCSEGEAKATITLFPR